MICQRPPCLTSHWRDELADRLEGCDGLVVGIDFDGTLAPIAEDPSEPTITPACESALETLANHPRAMVAVISGRELSDLKDRVDVPGVVYAGNHGLELCCGGSIEVCPDAARCRPAISRTVDRLSDRLAEIPGAEIEDKRITATVHVRRTPSDRVDDVRSAVETAVREAGDGLQITPGKQVFEIRPAVDWDKGSAMDRLVSSVPDGWQPVYPGDDVTDEDAFRAIRQDGIGVLVGSRERTDASYRLPTQEAVAPFLDWLATTAMERCG